MNWLMSKIREIIDRQHDARDRGALSMWTIYDHPSDYPESFVARLFEVRSGTVVATNDLVIAPLGTLRRFFASAGLHCLTRNDGDDPKIVETWL
jgi:hypothetical protein